MLAGININAIINVMVEVMSKIAGTINFTHDRCTAVRVVLCVPVNSFHPIERASALSLEDAIVLLPPNSR